MRAGAKSVFDRVDRFLARSAFSVARRPAIVSPYIEPPLPDDNQSQVNDGDAVYSPIAMIEPTGWNRDVGETSMPEVYGSITVPEGDGITFKKCGSFIGPGIMVAVGYMVRIFV